MKESKSVIEGHMRNDRGALVDKVKMEFKENIAKDIITLSPRDYDAVLFDLAGKQEEIKQ